MIVIEKLSGTKQCILKKNIKTMDYVYETTRLICQNSIFCLSFGGEQLFYDLLKYIKSDTDICVQERDDDLYTITEIKKETSMDYLTGKEGKDVDGKFV